MSDSLTLGLDVGSNSIGWALVDEEAQAIVATGVRVFPEGVNRDTKEAEVSKNEARRTARMARRQAARRASRTRRLRKMLVSVGLLPAAALLEPGNPARVTWENQAFKTADPYSLRAQALTKKLALHEIGRVLIHLSQRRGFLSNRKADRGRKDETKGMLGEISQLEADLKGRTLGEFLAQEQELHPDGRLRRRHTRREMYEKEFEAIWSAQQKHYPDLLTERLKYGSVGKQAYPRDPDPTGKKSALDLYGIHGCLFFQRPLYWPKSVIGACELEPKQKRCPRADRMAQRFRLFQEVNNLRVLDGSTARERILTQQERSTVVEYMADSSERSFDEIKKKLGLPNARFNLERGERKKLHGLPTDKQMKKVMGKTWLDATEQQKNKLVRELLDSEEPAIREHCKAAWDLDNEVVDKLLALQFSSGHASYGLPAIEKLLPFLEKGLPLMAPTGQPCAMNSAGYLQPHEKVPNQKEFLPAPPPITNPIVRQALFEIRKLVNAVLREHGKPAHIHIELAREIKGTFAQRQETSLRMRERERRRDMAAEKIRSWNLKPTRDAIDRFLLWEEQNYKCVYSGRVISQCQLLGGEVDVDHVLPYSRTLDDSLMNRVLCFRDENDRKGDRTPVEWLAERDPRKYGEVLKRADKLLYGKARKFREQTVALDDFLPRQLVDTQYIALQLHEYVRCLGAEVVCTKGNHTATLRKHWGLDRVLRHDDLNIKNRDDHRHHAVDAIVIALTDRSRLQQLSKLRKMAVEGEVMPEPWDHFRDHVEAAVNKINVSHRVSRKIHGALHEETLYGPTHKGERRDKSKRPWAKDWIEEEDHFVVRKSLEALSLNEVAKIRDSRVRELVEERLRQFKLIGGRKRRHGAEAAAPKADRKIPAEVWKEPLFLTPRGKAAGQAAPIKKVRVVTPQKTVRAIRGATTFVKPGKNHHLCLFECTDARGKKFKDVEIVSMLDVTQRLSAGEKVVRHNLEGQVSSRFLFSLSAGEMVLLVHGGKEQLYRFVKAGGTSKQMWFRLHTVGGKASEKTGVVSKMPNTLNARKVTVDLLGRVRWAND